MFGAAVQPRAAAAAAGAAAEAAEAAAAAAGKLVDKMRNDERFRVSRTADALWGGHNLFVQTAAVCSREKERERERERKPGGCAYLQVSNIM